MSDWLKGSLGVLLASTGGFLILKAIARKNTLGIAVTLSASVGLGLGLIATLMELLSFAQIRLTPLNLLVPMILSCLVPFQAVRHIFRGKPRSGLQSMSTRGDGEEETSKLQQERSSKTPEILLVGALILEIILTFSQTLLLPIESFDAVANWGLKAKAICQSGTIPTQFFLDSSYRNYAYHPDYPLLVPLAQSYLCLFLPEFNEYVSKLVFPCIYLACLLFMFGATGWLGLSRRGQMVFTLMLAGTPFFRYQSTLAYTDIVMSYYFFGGVAFLFFYMRRRERVLLVLSAVWLGLGAMTKNEGLALGLLCWLVLIFGSMGKPLQEHQRGRRPDWVLFLAVWLLVQGPWLIYKSTLHVTNDVVNRRALLAAMRWTLVERLPPILYHYQTQVFGLRNWNIVWILFLLALILRGKHIMKTEGKYLVLPVLLSLLVYTSIYLITPRDLVWHLKTSASRVFLHFLPVVVFALAWLYAEEKKASNKAETHTDRRGAIALKKDGH